MFDPRLIRRRWAPPFLASGACMAWVSLVTVLVLTSALHARTWTRPFKLPELSGAEREQLAELRARVEAVPEDAQAKRAVELIETKLASPLSENLRDHLIATLGTAYARMGDTERAISVYAGAMANRGNSPTGLVAADRLQRLLQESARYADAAEVVQSVLDGSKLSPAQEVYFTGKAGFFLAASGDPDAAVEMVKPLLSGYPDQGLEEMVGDHCDEVTVALQTRSTEHQYDLMKAMHDSLPSYGSTPRFLGNLAHVCQLSNRRGEALHYYQLVVDGYPDDHRVPAHLFEMGNICLDLEDPVGAYEHYGRLVALETDDPYTQRLQGIARGQLARVDEELELEKGIDEFGQVPAESVGDLADVALHDEGQAPPTARVAGADAGRPELANSGPAESDSTPRAIPAFGLTGLAVAGVVVLLGGSGVFALLWLRNRAGGRDPKR
ncbi:MAG TPA: tetratricopeptide repeat protein [Phycisphaerae bacterium]|nr:tetratricopeptide repeat protein [Phycisphaerae bacterium]